MNIEVTGVTVLQGSAEVLGPVTGDLLMIKAHLPIRKHGTGGEGRETDIDFLRKPRLY